MDARKAAFVHAGLRAGLGTGLLVAPRLAGAVWVGRDARRTSSRVYSGGLGARDAALGLGLVSALRGGYGVRPWIAAGMLADAADLGVTVRHRGGLPSLGAASIAVMAGGSVAVGAWLYRELV